MPFLYILKEGTLRQCGRRCWLSVQWPFPFCLQWGHWRNIRGERGLSSDFSMFSACSCGTWQPASAQDPSGESPVVNCSTHPPLWLALMDSIPATVASLIHLKTATKIISLKHKFIMDGGDGCTTMQYTKYH